MTYKKERGMGMELKIPENFFVGAAMSGPQTEGAYKTGGRLESIWDTWSDLSISDFYNKVGSYVGNNFYEKYEDDIKLLKSLHMDSFRTSMQWSRLLIKDGKLNQEGAQFYHKVCKCAKENQIELFMNLYHFDMPTYLFERGGWESRDVVEAYAAYARAAFREFGSEIRYWFTFNEPIVEPDQRYRNGFWYPFIKDAKRGMQVQYHLSLAHSLAVWEFRKAKEEGYVREDATAMHFMNECVVYIPWTTPPLLSGYLATAGDWRAILVQALILILGVLLYIPFVKINDVVMAKTMGEE